MAAPTASPRSPRGQHPAPAAPLAPAQWTGRALAIGLGIGVLLSVANLYMGLKTGWWDTGQITASILAFALAAALPGRRGLSALENNLAQTAATAVGAAPAAFNLLGAVPALALLGQEVSGWALTGLGLALAALGIVLALALRRRLLEEERLPFPTGVATAEVIRALHAGRGGARPARALAATGVAAAAFTAARELFGWIPQVAAPALRVLGTPAPALTLGIALDPMLVGAGMVAGLRTGLSVLAGACIAWGGFAPLLLRAGTVHAADYGHLVAWLAWPGVGLVLGAAVVSLASQASTFAGALRDLGRLGDRGGPAGRDWRLAAALALGAAVVAIALARVAFGMSLGPAVAGLALGLVLSVVCARAVGQTDILPAGEMAQIAQVALGGAGTPAASVGAGALAAGPAAQMGVSLWSLRAGQLLGAAPRLQARAMLAGTLVGAGVAIPTYRVLVRAHGIGTAALPAPAAVPWRAIGELVTRGGSALPPGALAAAVAGFAVGATLELASRRFRKVPSAAALGMGFIAPAHYAATICAGSVIAALWRRARPTMAGELAPAVGAGAIAGQAIAGAVAAALVGFGVVVPS